MSWLWNYNNNSVDSKITDSKKFDNKRENISNLVKSMIWVDTYGEHYNVKCYVCELNTITPFKHHVGHIIALSNGGTNDKSNLRPICDQCNLTMGKKNMDEFKKTLN